jgi:hypothetical protein
MDIPAVLPSGTHWIEGWLDPRAGLHALLKRQISVDVVVLGYNAVWISGSIPTFLRNILPPTSAQKTNINIFTAVRTSSLKSHVVPVVVDSNFTY